MLKIARSVGLPQISMVISKPQPRHRIQQNPGRLLTMVDVVNVKNDQVCEATRANT